jgi:hypothetical protein
MLSIVELPRVNRRMEKSNPLFYLNSHYLINFPLLLFWNLVLKMRVKGSKLRDSITYGFSH